MLQSLFPALYYEVIIGLCFLNTKSPDASLRPSSLSASSPCVGSHPVLVQEAKEFKSFCCGRIQVFRKTLDPVVNVAAGPATSFDPGEAVLPSCCASLCPFDLSRGSSCEQLPAGELVFFGVTSDGFLRGEKPRAGGGVI